MERGWLHGEGFLLCLILHLPLQDKMGQKQEQSRHKTCGKQRPGYFLLFLDSEWLDVHFGRRNAFTTNCSGFDQHGVDPAAFQAVFDRKAFRPVINFNIATHVNISFALPAILEVNAQLQLMTSFLWLNMIWYNPLIRWNPEEYRGIRQLSIATENLWLPDIFIKEFEGHIRYNKPMQVISICNLGIFYFPFDEQNCTLTFSSFIHTVENMVLGMEEEVQKISSTSQNLIQSKGECVLLGIHQRKMKMTVNANQYDQIIFYVTIRRRPRLYVINLLVPSGFLVAVNALSFYLPAESKTRAPFKMTLLLGYNVFLLMMNDLFSKSGIPLISVYFALCLSLMVLSLLETIFITYLLHLATTQPPPMPQWLHSLLLHCANPIKCGPTVPQKGTKGLGLTLAYVPGLKEPLELVGKVPDPQEAEANEYPGPTRTGQEDEAQKQRLVGLWVQFSHVMDMLLFRLYLLFMATSLITVIVLWNT